jgi:hypothetical protein
MSEPTKHERDLAEQVEARIHEAVEPIGQTLVEALAGYRSGLEHQVAQHLTRAAEWHEKRDNGKRGHAVGNALRVQALEIFGGVHREERAGTPCWQCGTALRTYTGAGATALLCPSCDFEHARELEVL